ncbi:MAG TPA: cell wall-binding protein, partial [Clostridiales bacterium]|nr:cell wall-binding protein [Clostridiales bacterium]
LDISDKRYYFTKDGVMVSGKWLEIDGKWYYCNADGSLAKNTKVDGYEVDKNGVRKTK